MFIEWPSWKGNGPRVLAGIDKPFSISALVSNFEKSVVIAWHKKKKTDKDAEVELSFEKSVLVAKYEMLLELLTSLFNMFYI
jgi:hypothetical protein